MLYDNHNRPLRYLRLAVTERCNLRCHYCMPEEGLPWSKKDQILTYEEMLRLVEILANLGISKVRITGGEPFVRKDLLPFMSELKQIKGIDKLNITTNGTAPLSSIETMEQIGVNSVNLSLDSIDAERFAKVTRRDEFEKVWNYYKLLEQSTLNTKINAVVMENHNLGDILPMSALTVNDDVSIRFIEEMPFNGGSKGYTPIEWNFRRIINHIKTQYPNLNKLDDAKSSTSYNYQIPGAKGSIGVIPAYSRTICGTCDRIRLTPKGELMTCLYQNKGFSFRDFMRDGATDIDIKEKFLKLFGQRAKDGFESEKRKEETGSFQSMATIGG
ncbi:cyclic pyranopterin monophosphate synthase subunit MoaA [Roseivirga pacifica]|uniref:GTP 3',8-cyclase n=1 Tax=Roseivirga pacifica TaxID=1267423 RepID=A0A1I0Q2P1_9BACT|nr:GTP 3',8-cyclase MoaA [Roseivirga pacifica]RKQ43296.1 cyclic pyranopterin monophosphate synthase subunit MoaA [Roseivirga pacifica]SEW21235.1 cyclic pyranopterin monophosphate synthase subunit MoaA [Roseivirga pacifica]